MLTNRYPFTPFFQVFPDTTLHGQTRTNNLVLTPFCFKIPMNKTASRLFWTAAATGLVMAGRAYLRSRRKADFRDRVVLITGGSRGLGLNIARHFADEGARIAICARSEDDLAEAQEDLGSYGAEVRTYVCDVTDTESVHKLMARIRVEMGPIEVLVNNAGVISIGPYNAMNREDFQKSMEVHFWAAYNCINAALPHMRENGWGRIVNIASIGGKLSVPHLLPYSVGKFALVGYSEGLRAELMLEGVLVTTVCPGLMRTGSHLNADVKGGNDQEYRWFKILDSLPIMSMEVGEAALQIVDACRYGEAELVLTIPARFAVLLKGIAPSAMQELMSLSAFALPKAEEGAFLSRKGKEIPDSTTPFFLEKRLENAAADSNETNSLFSSN